MSAHENLNKIITYTLNGGTQYITPHVRTTRGFPSGIEQSRQNPVAVVTEWYESLLKEKRKKLKAEHIELNSPNATFTCLMTLLF